MKIKNKQLDFPLIQGGMGIGVSLSSLAGNVMKEGCMGVLSAAHPGYNRNDFYKDSLKANKQALADEVCKARDLSNGNGLLAVNIMCASKDFEEYARHCSTLNIDALICGAGLPLSLPSMVDNKDILLAPIVSSGKAAELICKIWNKRYNVLPDFIVIEGSDAGGHLGFKKDDLLNGTTQSLDDILADVLVVVNKYEIEFNKNIPVFVAGGIYDGKDMYKYEKLGASGVQMATRFICTYECDASNKFKEAVLNCNEEDIKIVKSPTGFPGRALNNKFIKELEIKGNVAISKCLKCLTPCNPSDTPYCISIALINSVKGNIDKGLLFVGTNAYRIKNMLHVSELINEIKQKYVECGGTI